eukprot:COSAG04_NODE_2470_length_4072_cov_4.007299_2_plen_455_part_00
MTRRVSCCRLTEEDLKEIVPMLKPRRLIFQAVQDLQQQQEVNGYAGSVVSEQAFGAIASGTISKLDLLEAGMSDMSATRVVRAVNPRGYWGDPIISNELLDLDQEYVNRFGADAMTGKKHVEMHKRAIRVLQSWPTPAGLADMFKQPIADLEQHALAPISPMGTEQPMCVFCGCFFDLEDRKTHLHDSHFEQHRAFREMKATYFALCTLMAVAHHIGPAFGRNTVLAEWDLEEANELRAELTPDNPRLLALLSEERELLDSVGAQMQQIGHVCNLATSTINNMSSWNLRDWFSKCKNAAWTRQLQVDRVGARFRPNALPWATLNLFFADSAAELLRLLNDANGFRPRCLDVLRAAASDHATRAHHAASPTRAAPESKAEDGTDEPAPATQPDWQLQAALAAEEAEAAEAALAVAHAKAEAGAGDEDDEWETMVTKTTRERDRKRAKGKEKQNRE